jgi:hypothetical protein
MSRGKKWQKKAREKIKAPPARAAFYSAYKKMPRYINTFKNFGSVPSIVSINRSYAHMLQRGVAIGKERAKC